jgi:tripartite-type tricarboxylate transporter receptor subunit TctC
MLVKASKQGAAIFVLGLIAAGFIGPANGQGYPSRPVTIVVPFPPGGGTDIVARFLASEFSQRLGRQFVVENRSGASGNIGTASVARAEPDGHTLVVGTPYPLLLNKLMSTNLPYDPEADLTPVAMLGKQPHILATRPNSPYKTLKDVTTRAKDQPGTISSGIPGIGTTSHLVIESLLNRVGGKMVIVPYRGTTPVADILNGAIDISVSFTSSYVALVKSGGLHAIAVSTERRSDQLPEVPTIQELGYPDFEVSAWTVLSAPAGTPKSIIDTLNRHANDLLKDERWVNKLRELDVQVQAATAAEVKAFIELEHKRYAPIIKAANIKM